MALTPKEDKQAFWNRIRNDPWIEKSINLKDKTIVEASHAIRQQRTIDDAELDGKIRAILIFDVASNELIGPYETSCVQIDVLAPSSAQSWADGILSQICALCGVGWPVNGREIAKIVSVGELTSASGYYRCGARFYYYSCTKTKIKKL